MIKLLIFDFDGTISDCRKIAVKSLLAVLKRRKWKFDENKAISLLGVKMQIIFKKLGLPLRELESARKEFYDLMLKDVKKIKFCVSVRPLMDLKRNFKMIVVSNSEARFVLASAKKLGVLNLFDAFHGANEFVSKDKEIRKLMRKYGVRGKETICIGDRYSDIVYARKAGCISVGIYNKCSWSTLKEILKEKPDFVISDFSDLKKILTEMKN